MDKDIIRPIDEVDIAKMSISFCLSTPTTDRVDDIVQMNSISLKSHQKLPYLCFNHNRQNPIGRCEDYTTKEYTLKWTPEGLVGKAYFAQDSWDSMWLFDKVANGTLRGMSPGFIRKSFKPNPESKKGGLIYVEGDGNNQNELLEATVCTFGENSEAFIMLVEKTLKDTCIKAPSKWILDEFAKIQTVNKTLTVPVTMPTTTVVEKKKEETNTQASENKAEMPPGCKCLKELHSYYAAGKALTAKHMPSQEKESPVREHLENVDKALDGMIEENKTLHDERYSKEHGELEDIPSNTEETSKSLRRLMIIEKEFKLLTDNTDKLIRENVELKRKLGIR